MRRSIVLRLPPKLVFPERSLSGFLQILNVILGWISLDIANEINLPARSIKQGLKSFIA
jgi:hypothetical protein